MMREIKFRGRDGDGIWHYGSLIATPPQEIVLIAENALRDDGLAEVLASTVGQFTGLKDHKGREIYEGDVLRDPDGKTLEVVWNNGAGSWECAREDYHFLFIMRYIDVMTVIGNIYDNPELLEAQA